MLKSCLKLIAGIVGGSLVLTNTTGELMNLIEESAMCLQTEGNEQPDTLDIASQTESDSADPQTFEDHNDQQKREQSEPEQAVQVTGSSTAQSWETFEPQDHTKTYEYESEVNSSTSQTDLYSTIGQVYESETIQDSRIDQPVSDLAQPAQQTQAARRQVQTGFITPELTGMYSSRFLQDIRDGKNRLYYTGSSSDADFSLSEIVSFYCSLPEGIRYYEASDSSGTYLELEEPERSMLQQKVAEADQGWAYYAQYIGQTAESLDLSADDTEIVDEINQFICANYDYEVTNSGMPKFLSTHRGQCWHYAKMFADLCNSVGIPAWKVENDTHAWNQVYVNGQTYMFDPTFNDTSGDWTRYSWQQS